jgi:hypothetical protein
VQPNPKGAELQTSFLSTRKTSRIDIWNVRHEEETWKRIGVILVKPGENPNYSQTIGRLGM